MLDVVGRRHYRPRVLPGRDELEAPVLELPALVALRQRQHRQHRVHADDVVAPAKLSLGERLEAPEAVPVRGPEQVLDQHGRGGRRLFLPPCAAAAGASGHGHQHRRRRERVGVHVVQQGLERVRVHVVDAHVARGLLLGRAEELLPEHRRPGGEHQLVRGEHLTAHLELHVRADGAVRRRRRRRLQEAGKGRGQVGHGPQPRQCP